MTAAFGTSTPTSMTVVDTRMSVERKSCPAAAERMAELFTEAELTFS